MYSEKIPWKVNFDESRIPPYTLPEALRCCDGSMVKTAAEWRTKRRPELLQMFRDVMYGAPPPMPDQVHYELLSEKDDAIKGKAVRREVRIHFKMNNGRSHAMDVLYYLPTRKKGKAPVFVGLTFHGNHVVSPEPDIRMTGLAYEKHGDFMRERGGQARRFPLERILGRGYAVAVASYHDIFPDHEQGWTDSIYQLFFTADQLRQHPVGYSAIGAWSWGISRILDYLQTIPEIDGAKAAVFGHSRLGKTALWTGAQDERFQLVCVNDSGCGGAALSRRLYGETLYSMYYSNHVGKWWFTGTLQEKSLHPENLPLDQHELIALVAPRAVAIHSATLDRWADPRGEYLSAYHAGKVYRLFGRQVLESITPPAPDTPAGTDVSYFLRKGKHDLLLADWEHYLDMADRYLKNSTR